MPGAQLMRPALIAGYGNVPLVLFVRMSLVVGVYLLLERGVGLVDCLESGFTDVLRVVGLARDHNAIIVEVLLNPLHGGISGLVIDVLLLGIAGVGLLELLFEVAGALVLGLGQEMEDAVTGFDEVIKQLLFLPAVGHRVGHVD